MGTTGKPRWWTRKSAWVVVATIGVVAVLGLVGAGWIGRQAGRPQPLPGALGAVPAWLTNQPWEVQRLYRWAADHRDALQYIPCYCGCFSPGLGAHSSNADCYVLDREQNWAYEQHASG